MDSSPEIKAIKDRGELVPDTLVGEALLAQIFDPEVNDGVGLVIDGFPRTALQVIQPAVALLLPTPSSLLLSVFPQNSSYRSM